MAGHGGRLRFHERVLPSPPPLWPQIERGQTLPAHNSYCYECSLEMLYTDDRPQSQSSSESSVCFSAFSWQRCGVASRREAWCGVGTPTRSKKISQERLTKGDSLIDRAFSARVKYIVRQITDRLEIRFCKNLDGSIPDPHHLKRNKLANLRQ